MRFLYKWNIRIFPFLIYLAYYWLVTFISHFFISSYIKNNFLILRVICGHATCRSSALMLPVPGVFFLLIFLMISCILYSVGFMIFCILYSVGFMISCILYNVGSSISLLITHSHKIQMAVSSFLLWNIRFTCLVSLFSG